MLMYYRMKNFDYIMRLNTDRHLSMGKGFEPSCDLRNFLLLEGSPMVMGQT